MSDQQDADVPNVSQFYPAAAFVQSVADKPVTLRRASFHLRHFLESQRIRITFWFETAGDRDMHSTAPIQIDHTSNSIFGQKGCGIW